MRCCFIFVCIVLFSCSNWRGYQVAADDIASVLSQIYANKQAKHDRSDERGTGRSGRRDGLESLIRANQAAGSDEILTDSMTRDPAAEQYNRAVEFIERNRQRNQYGGRNGPGAGSGLPPIEPININGPTNMEKHMSARKPLRRLLMRQLL